MMRVTLNFLNYSWRHDPKQSTPQVISCSSLKTLWMMVNIPHHSATNFLSVFYPTTLEIFEHLCLMTSHTYYWNIFISITDNSSHFSIMNTKFRLWILWLLAYFQMSLLPARWRHKVSWRTFNCSHNDKTPCMRSRRALARCFTLRFTPCSWYNPASLEREASFENIKSQRCTTQGELLPCTWLKSRR